MLFAQMNGQGAHPVEDSTEADVLQNVACDIGPRVDGIQAARVLPQAMGAFVTWGAQGACGMRPSEQHVSTTVPSGIGQAAAMSISTDSGAPTPPAPTPSSTTKNLISALRIAPQFAIMSQGSAPTPAPPTDSGGSFFPSTVGPEATFPTGTTPTTPTTPTAALPTGTYQNLPAGSITAFSTKTGMWRVAIPVGTTMPPQTSGLADIFGLGADATFTEVPAVASPPPSATQVPENDFETKTGTTPLFKKPLFWVAVAGGLIVLGGGAMLLFRRKRTPAAAAPAPAAAPKAAYY